MGSCFSLSCLGVRGSLFSSVITRKILLLAALRYRSGTQSVPLGLLFPAKEQLIALHDCTTMAFARPIQRHYQ